MFVIEDIKLIGNVMLKNLYFLNVAFYENYIYEFVISDGCLIIHLLLIYDEQKQQILYSPLPPRYNFSLLLSINN